MTVLQVVTLISHDGSFGGPASVALTHAEALTAAAVDVEVVAGSTVRQGEMRVRGVSVRLFRAKRLTRGSHAGTFSPALLLWWWRSQDRFDAVHVHLARDLVTAPLAFAVAVSGRRLIIQTHGMVQPDRRISVRVVDRLLLRRAVRRAEAVLYLTAEEREGLLELFPDVLTKLVHVPNGVSELVAGHERSSASDPVLFCSRLHARKRPTAFVRMAASLRAAGDAHLFEIVGPDDGQMAEVLRLRAELGLTDVLTVRGGVSYDQVLEHLRRSSVLVLPSHDEPFPMVVLEALAVGTPVVISQSCGLADVLGAAGAATVVPEDLGGLAAAVQRLLVDEAHRETQIAAGLQAVRTRFSSQAVGAQLIDVYTGRDVRD